MNYLSILAFLFAGVVFGVAVVTATDNPGSMLDFHGFLIVIGGSVAATAISFQVDRMGTMLKVFWNRA